MEYSSRHITGLSTISWDVLKIVLLFIVARLVIALASRTIKRVLYIRAVRMESRRRETMISLISNVIRYTIYFIFVAMTLQILQFHIETLLAGAGIAGLAIGFGAQSVIKDLLTGFFILFEDQYGVGDYVTINGQTGTVTQIGIRLTRLQVWTGEIESIPNGMVQQVTNFSRTNSLAVIDVGVNYTTALGAAMRIVEQVIRRLRQKTQILQERYLFLEFKRSKLMQF